MMQLRRMSNLRNSEGGGGGEREAKRERESMRKRGRERYNTSSVTREVKRVRES